MKKALRNKALTLLLALLALGLAAWSLVAAEPQPAGQVEDVTGQVEAQSPSSSARMLAKGNPVFAQDVITTKTDKDKARIKFLDESVLEIGPSSQVALAGFAFDPADKTKSNQTIKLARGIFRYVTGKVVAQNPDNLKMQSPLAVIGIRGTTTDHWIQAKEKMQNGSPVWEDQAELHSLRETTTHSQVTVQTETERLVLTKPGDVAWVRPNLPGEVRALTPEEMQDFARTPFSPEPFDPAPRHGLTGGGTGE